MNLFDIVILVIIGFCLIRGGFRGLIKEVAAIVGVLGGFYGAYRYYQILGGILSKWISTDAYSNIVSFLIIFCTVFLIINILGIIIRYAMNIVFSGWLDCLGGVVFGLFKGALIVSVLFFALTTFLPMGTPLIQQSKLAPFVSEVSEVMAQLVSEDMKVKFSSKIQELKKSWTKK
ncbi:MAG: CvpA family protein [Deltaproteobacteria bacterium]|nr:CvpA family protein [Deltaproteobacteria bacterium]